MSEANGIPKISEDLAEHIETLPTLNTIFPYVFANSTMIDNIEIPCAACGKDIDITSIRGAVQIYPHSIAVDSYACCYGCRTITPARVRFADDGTILYLNEKQEWTKGVFTERNFSLFDKIKAILAIGLS